MEIRTARLLLRPARESDLEPIHAILSDPQATAYWSTPPHRDLEQSREWLGTMLAIPAGEGEDFIVEQDGRVIGKAGFYRFPEIGYIFRPDVWGRGYAAEALRPVLDRAFDVHRLKRAEADVDPGNERSLQLLGRLGFREVGRDKGTWQIGEEWRDSVYLHLDGAGWSAARV